MEFLQLYIDAFKNILNIQGKANRTAYWSFVIIALIVGSLLSALIPLLAGVYGIVALIAYITLCIRRGRDIGNPLWALLALFPPIGTIILGILPIK